MASSASSAVTALAEAQRGSGTGGGQLARQLAEGALEPDVLLLEGGDLVVGAVELEQPVRGPGGPGEHAVDVGDGVRRTRAVRADSRSCALPSRAGSASTDAR
jgi:hypothetical protein